MTDNVDLSSAMQDWVRLAGMELIQGSQSKDGRTEIWNRGGERRYFIGVMEGYFVVTSSDRMAAEKFHLGALTMELLEKYLYGHFGGSVRKARRLPRVQKPFRRDELKHGFRIEEVVFAGQQEDALLDPAGLIVAIAADDRLVELSHYVEASSDVIRDSFLDPEGSPLFAVFSSN